MIAKVAVTEFQFVNSMTVNGLDDPAVRKVIRRHAMKNTSTARKHAGNYGKHNLRQYPVFRPADMHDVFGKGTSAPRKSTQSVALNHHKEDPETQKVPERNAAEQWSLLKRPAYFGTVSPSLCPTGYEAKRMKYNFDMLDLSSPTAIHVGRATGQVFASDPSQLIHLLRYKQSSYFSYLPSLYGYSDCVNDAVACVAARVRQIISPLGEWQDEAVISAYLRALNSLQKALGSPMQP